MTVAELRHMLSDIPDSVEIFIVPSEQGLNNRKPLTKVLRRKTSSGQPVLAFLGGKK